MKNILIIFLIFISNSVLSLECQLTIERVSLSDTLFYVYYIKNDYVRIDEYDKYHKLKNSIIKKESYIYINHNTKTYKTLNTKNLSICDNCVLYNKDIINYKKILNYKCRQYIIKDYSNNKYITYWLSNDVRYKDIKLSIPFLSVNDSYLYLLSINTTGVPLEINVKSFLRYDIENIFIKKIELNKNINNLIFNIPKDYKISNDDR